ncbi:MAG TPA: hypothetical protein VF041_23020 [Gemmatimonadaceae bacterium]
MVASFGGGYINHPAAGPFGIRVARPTAALPQTGTASIYRVSGGRCAIYLVGMFTAAADATVTTLQVVNTTTGAAADRGATTNLSSATAITSSPIGASLALANTVGGALNTAGGAIVMQMTPHLANIGTIDLTTSASNAAARVRWVLYYVPIDIGAYVSVA